MMTQIIPICIGQAGIEVAQKFWELLGIEHKIDQNGNLLVPEQFDPSQEKLDSFYHEVSTHKYKLNAVCVDLGTDGISSIQAGTFKGLYQSENLVSNISSSEGRFSKAYNLGNQTIDISLDPIRKMVEKTRDFGGFMIINSMNGGTGSGLCKRVLQKLNTQFDKSQRFCINLYSDKQTKSASSIYNSYLSTNAVLQMANTSLVYDNQAINYICKDICKVYDPKYKDLNQIIAHSLSSITTGLRYDLWLNSKLEQFRDNFIPYDRTKFLLCGYAPYSVPPQYIPTGAQITQSLFNKHNILAECDLQSGKLMGAGLVYRGNYVPKDICCAMAKVRNWCPTGLKCGISYCQNHYFQQSIVPQLDRTALLICNSSSVKSKFNYLNTQFQQYFKNKVDLHQYFQEGTQQLQFQQVNENLLALYDDYIELQKQTEYQAQPQLEQSKIDGIGQ